MDGRADNLGSMLDDPQSLTVFALVFAVVFIGVVALGLHLMKPPKILDGRSALRAPGRLSTSRQQVSQNAAEPARRSTDAFADLKRTLLAVSRVLGILLVGSLAALTIISYFETDPDDGSRLFTIVLATGTLILGHHLHRMDRRHRPIGSDGALQSSPEFDVRAELARKIGTAMLAGGKVEWKVASPEVYSLDQNTLDRAKAMVAEGSAMDQICRAIAPQYEAWDFQHRQAYQAVVRAAIEHKG